MSGTKKEQPGTAQVDHPFDESATLLNKYLSRVADIANDNSEPLPSIFRRTASDIPSPPAKMTPGMTPAMASYTCVGILLLLVAVAVVIYMTPSNMVSPAATASADPGAITIAPPYSGSTDDETLRSQEDEKPESLVGQSAVPIAEAERWSGTMHNLKQVVSEQEPPTSAAETFKQFLEQHRTSQAAGANPRPNDPLPAPIETSVENTRR